MHNMATTSWSRWDKVTLGKCNYFAWVAHLTRRSPISRGIGYVTSVISDNLSGQKIFFPNVTPRNNLSYLLNVSYSIEKIFDQYNIASTLLFLVIYLSARFPLSSFSVLLIGIFFLFQINEKTKTRELNEN